MDRRTGFIHARETVSHGALEPLPSFDTPLLLLFQETMLALEKTLSAITDVAPAAEALGAAEKATSSSTMESLEAVLSAPSASPTATATTVPAMTTVSRRPGGREDADVSYDFGGWLGGGSTLLSSIV